jgi:cell division protein FtsW
MGPGDQVREALVAIGSGGLTGVGLGEGGHKLGFVPEIQTDFIFAMVGEELGFLGCVGVVLTFMLFTWYGSRLAWHARALGSYACYLAAGAVFIVAFQAVINLAVVTGLAPTKGIALPFLSKGGSNLLMVSICVGLLVNIARRTADAVGEDPWAAS